MKTEIRHIYIYTKSGKYQKTIIDVKTFMVYRQMWGYQRTADNTPVFNWLNLARTRKLM